MSFGKIKIKRMKRIALLLILMVSASIVFAQDAPMTRKEKKAAQKAGQIEKTKALVASNAWQFDARQMMPSSGKSRSLTTSYNIVVNDKQLSCYLPYFGRAYRAEYGSAESPLIFKSEIFDYKVENEKKGAWLIRFKTSNKNDKLDFTLHISENGSTSLNINSTDRQPISFHGDLVEIEEQK